MVRILIENKADVNKGGEGDWSPLMWAVSKGNFSTVQRAPTEATLVAARKVLTARLGATPRYSTRAASVTAAPPSSSA